jgi:hypothetical protein
VNVVVSTEVEVAVVVSTEVEVDVEVSIEVEVVVAVTVEVTVFAGASAIPPRPERTDATVTIAAKPTASWTLISLVLPIGLLLPRDIYGLWKNRPITGGFDVRTSPA